MKNEGRKPLVKKKQRSGTRTERKAPCESAERLYSMDRPRTIPGPSPASVLDPDLCSCLISGLGYLLRQDLDDDAAVLRAARLGLVRRDRLLFAVADHVDLVQRDLLRLIQVALHRFGAVEADLVVRCLGADV